MSAGIHIYVCQRLGKPMPLNYTILMCIRGGGGGKANIS